MAEFHEDPGPGSGRRAARADFVSDAPRLALNGRWRFRLSDTAAGTGLTLPDPALDDTGWETIPVPSHWVLEGHDRPLYTNTAYPFPIDPPYLPDHNPTGDYRLRFDLPPGWPPGRGVLRFQGVDSCGTVWLNGELLGHSKGSRLPFEFDVTGLLRPRGNLLAVRVQRWSSGSYLEDQDMWWLPGIFRDVELLSRPEGGIDDFTVRASYASGAGTLLITADAPGLVEIPELGLAVPTGEQVTVPDVQPWSAEHPRLYRGTLSAAGETIDLAVGFRTVEISGGRLLINGAPVLFRGVNRHEHHPDRGRALDRDTMIRDIELMKRHNVNAVRTAHYPPHPEFLRLCDEYGLWVVDECDIETHGFVYAGWEGNPPAEPMWREALLDRARRMVERDKNHPSVVVWSLGNESGSGPAFGDIDDWIRRRDPTRPLHYERDPAYRHSDFYSLMYPSLDDLERIGQRKEETPAGVVVGSEEDVRRRGLPFLLCEYAHAMGNGPGSLVDYQTILESYERFCGAFVWEWIDHGLTGHDSLGRPYFRHGGDIDAQPNGERYCLDGLLFPDRTPSPGLGELRKAIEPVGITVEGASVVVANKYDAVSLGHLEFRWRVEVDGVRSATGPLTVPHCPARSSVRVPLPAAAVPDESRPGTSPAPGQTSPGQTSPGQASPRQASPGQASPGQVASGQAASGQTVSGVAGGGEVWLTVEAVLAADTRWAPAGHVIAFGQARLGTSPRRRPPGRRRNLAGRRLTPPDRPLGAVTDRPGAVSSHVDAVSARLDAVARLDPAKDPQPAQSPISPDGSPPGDRGAGAQGSGPGEVRLGGAAFDATTGRLRRLGGLELDGPTFDVWRAPTENDRGQGPRNALAADWEAVGLDRFLHRGGGIERPDDGTIVVRGRSGPATRTLGFRTTCTYRWQDGALHLRIEADPVGDWHDTAYGHLTVSPPRVGARFALPGGYTDVMWFGRGPGESYADSRAAARVGRYARSIDALQTPYVVPQENGNHVETRWLELSGPGLPILRVDGEPHLDFTARRWTSEALQAARRPHDLTDSGRVWLNLDHGQQGIGSASCGPALPGRYRLAVRPYTWSMTLSVVD
ncbi:glycoside hydrolase family 2 TIM barrel-domain containing protein [Nonomuraea sp. NPDC049709]|uniref:glycoside hydrolase family 2 TIM barrel-domain containing protein n=1 Tax=Nonomuraea sp. NPDC049709 TaxID=3154736 RepID=UPI003447530C